MRRVASGAAPGPSRARRAGEALVPIVALACLAGCGILPGPEGREPCPNETPRLAPPDIAQVPDTLSACGGRFVLGGDLWRDFMPVSPPGGDPLRAIVTLSECDSMAVPDSLRLVHLWVTTPGAYWSTDFNPEPVPGAAHELSAIARCGPKWEPGTKVDVIVSVRCGAGALAFARARDVTIKRTD